MIKRPLVWILGAYLSGLFLAFEKLSILLIIIVIIGLFLMNYLFFYRIKIPWICRKDTFLWSLPFLVLLGFYATSSCLKTPEVDGQFDREIHCELIGTVKFVVEKQKCRVIYVKNNQLILKENRSYLCENAIIYTTDKLVYRPGNRIKVSGTLQKFSEASNPGQFNEALYYRIENIDFKFQSEQIKIINSNFSQYLNILDHMKRKLINVYQTILPEKESGTLVAMLLGDKYLLPDEIKQLYQVNGISHVLAISGLHISLIGMFIFWILKHLKVPIIPATFITILFIYSYGVLTNFSVSTNRAVVMMVVLLASTLFGKTYDLLSAMALSAFFILLQNPLQILSAGFLLSFSAVLGIAVLYPCMKRLFPTENVLLNSLFLSLCAQLSTTPFILYFFYQFPSYSLLINLIILPFITVLTLTSILAGILGAIHPSLGIFLIGGSNYILKFYEWICKLGESLPGNLLTVGKPGALRLFLYNILIAIFVGAVGKYGKKYLILLLAAALCIILLPRSSSGLQVTFLDVGQGDSIFLKSKSNTTYLIDGGSSDIKNVGQYRLQPFLLSEGTDSLDYVIITHSDKDHISGIRELLEGNKIKVSTLILPYLQVKDSSYVELESLARRKGVIVRYICTGDWIGDGKLSIFCLHPAKDYIPSTVNSYSTVLSISYGEFDMLLTGDLQPDGEELVLQNIKQQSIWRKNGSLPSVDYELLKVAHHGSRYSTMEGFLSCIRPEIALVSCGRENSYGHPHSELIERLEAAESKVLITFDTGAVTVTSDGKNIKLKRYLKH